MPLSGGGADSLVDMAGYQGERCGNWVVSLLYFYVHSQRDMVGFVRGRDWRIKSSGVDRGS